MSIFDPDNLRGAVRRARALLDRDDQGQESQGRTRRGRVSPEQREKRELRRKRRELSRVRQDLKSSGNDEKHEHHSRKKEVKAELFQMRLDSDDRDEDTVTADEPGMLPSFVIIGAKKCGTTSLHHLITQHPNVEQGAMKEPGYFANQFDEGLDWYRRCFPPPTWHEGRLSITGEATPSYLGHPLAPSRMADLIPESRVISLLRDPVDRAYSDYQQSSRGREDGPTFEESLRKEETLIASRLGAEDFHFGGFLSRGIYVDQLIRWRRFFPDEQTLVLKSEDLYERTLETLQQVQAFLDLPAYQPESQEARRVGRYTEDMAPQTRRWLQDFFEPHNQRLYEYLGRDLGW